jgi:ABC-type glycerol-3-phosphate transport system substrate-binding protein
MSDTFGKEFTIAVDENLKVAVPGYMYFPGSGEIGDRIIDAVIRISQGEDADTVMKELNDQAEEIFKEQGLAK